MNSISNISRRSFLKGSALGSGGLVLAIAATHSPNLIAKQLESNSDNALTLFLSIATNGEVTILAMSPEIGQGSRTSMPTIIADELEADWSRVIVKQAGPDPRLGDQGVGGSSAIRDNWQGLRMAGASARTMLEQAAASVFKVPVSEVTASQHQVLHQKSGRALGYGELAEIAAKLKVPDAADVRLKNPKDFTLIGTDVAPVDLDAIVLGKAQYSQDVSLAGMKYAMMLRSPVIGGKLKSFDASAATAVAGVERVLEVEGATSPPLFNSVGGLAVIAKNTWAAKKGVAALQVEWDAGPNSSFESKAYRQYLENSVSKPGKKIRSRGDVDSALSAAKEQIEAAYYVPHQSHAPMEPPAALAHYTDDAIEVWTSTQGPEGIQKAVAKAVGLPKEKVRIHILLAGGGFGRRGKPDYAVEAAILSKKMGQPIKLIWSREDDMKHSFYHAACAQHLTAGIDANGKINAWRHRTAFPSITSTFSENASYAANWEMGLGAADVPYDIPNISVENGEAKAHLRIGWVRSVDNINHAFALGSFVDEIAQKQNKDSADFLLDLIGKPRHIDLSSENGEDLVSKESEYFNYSQDIAIYPQDTARMAHVIKLAKEKSGWGKPLAEGRGQGIAFHRSFLTYVACVIEVGVNSNGDLLDPEVHYAVDCGRVINPDRVKAQFEGGAVFAMGLAHDCEITASNGSVDQSNFHDYRVCRSNISPKVHVHLVDSENEPTGVGEPPVPPFAPALCNAIYQACGKRIRELPIGKQLRTV